jgi:hypothetical protein
MLRRHSQRSDYAALAARQVMEARSPRSHSSYWVWLLLVLLGFMALVAVIVKDYRRVDADDANVENAVLAAQTFVKQNLGPGIVPHFAPRNWTKVDRVGEQYVVSGWVEAAPKVGFASLAYDYTCTVFRNLDGAWYPSNIDLRPQ